MYFEIFTFPVFFTHFSIDKFFTRTEMFLKPVACRHTTTFVCYVSFHGLVTQVCVKMHVNLVLVPYVVYNLEERLVVYLQCLFWVWQIWL